MKKAKAAPQNGTAPNPNAPSIQTRGNGSTQRTRAATKLEMVSVHLLESGPEGISALSSLAGLHDLNPRNSVSNLRRNHGITILDAFFEHQHSGGGKAHFKRYWLPDRSQARKVSELVNILRELRLAEPLDRRWIARRLAIFPDTPLVRKPAA